MIIKRLNRCRGFIAGDKSFLKELLNPRKQDFKIHYSLAWARVKPGKRTLRHRLNASEVYYILKGTGRMHINKEEKHVKKGDTIYIPTRASQFIENIGKIDLEFFCIVDPAWQPDAEEIFEK